MRTIFSVILWTTLMGGFLITGMAIGEQNGLSVCLSHSIYLIPETLDIWV